MDKQRNKLENKKIPLYVSTYEELYDFIKNGDLEPGEKLPGENDLAKKFGVSRGTLRQALLLLQEDGIIYNRQGIGNFIIDNTNNIDGGLEEKSIIPLQFSEKECRVVLDEVVYQPATKIIQKNLELDDAELMVMFELVFAVEEEIIASMDAFILYEELKEMDVSLTDRESMKDFILNYMEEATFSTQTNIRIVEAREYVAESIEVEVGTPVFCFYEIMYSKSGVPNLYSKTYCLPEHFDFNLIRK